MALQTMRAGCCRLAGRMRPPSTVLAAASQDLQAYWTPAVASLRSTGRRSFAAPAKTEEKAGLDKSDPGIGLCSWEELEKRDAAVAAGRADRDKFQSKQASIGQPFDRKVYVANLRTKKGLVPKMVITDGEGVQRFAFTEADVEALSKLLPTIKAEFIRYGKKLT
eukprot:TRINITY_DN39325_c0_g1_i1.p1 TRINITY_DN39325_c0_g1~~TRINITY_DN39325_c0_g1_i1.p1  ORF type:complete len:165 (-),score=43.23 TRINITY_DN39325_c0_g1_i1:32-526(-)